ncbi:hypothetical protein Golomagni_05203 [Golovinomyces magnicellulatus]|nr:hypothetical protein Golomagni_05203 [Golovinomyces magnicellulatus]
MRATPPVASAFSRDLPPGGDTVRVDGNDVFLPGGSRIAYSAYSMHHRQDMYGNDAEAFRPERWFESDIEKLRYMTFTNDMLFGHGKYQCLGKVVAQMEMSKVVFELFRAFDLAIIDPVRPWTWRNHLGLFRIKDMWVQITDRAVKY